MDVGFWIDGADSALSAYFGQASGSDTKLDNTDALIAGAESLSKGKGHGGGTAKKPVRLLLVLLMLFAVSSVLIYGFLAGYSGYLSEPAYARGDIIDDNVSDSCPRIVLGYERGADQYESRFVEAIDGVWVYASRYDVQWDDRRSLERYYPFVVGHVDNIATILDYEAYRLVRLNNALASIPAHKDSPKLNSRSDLEVNLRLFPLDDYYEVDISDCSEMSAYMEWWLENHGVHSYLVTGEKLPHPEIKAGKWIYSEDPDGGPHVWVISFIEDRTVLIECTGVYVVPSELEHYYAAEYVFEDLEELVTYYHEEGYDGQAMLEDFDWWVGLPTKFEHFEIVTYQK